MDRKVLNYTRNGKGKYSAREQRVALPTVPLYGIRLRQRDNETNVIISRTGAKLNQFIPDISASLGISLRKFKKRRYRRFLLCSSGLGCRDKTFSGQLEFGLRLNGVWLEYIEVLESEIWVWNGWKVEIQSVQAAGSDDNGGDIIASPASETLLVSQQRRYCWILHACKVLEFWRTAFSYKACLLCELQVWHCWNFGRVW